MEVDPTLVYLHKEEIQEGESAEAWVGK
jgi:hypothetical protein